MNLSSYRKENSNEFEIRIAGLDWQTKERIMHLLLSLEKNKPMYYSNDSEIKEEKIEFGRQVGDLNVITAGVYNGLTVSEVFERNGYKGISDIMLEETLFGMNFIRAIEVVFEAEQYLLWRHATGLMEAELSSQEIRSCFRWLIGDDASDTKFIHAITDYAREHFELDSFFYNPPIVTKTKQPDFVGLSVTDIYNKYGLSGLSQLLRTGDREEPYYNYAKEFTTKILEHHKLLDKEDFLKSFAPFFRELDVQKLKPEELSAVFAEKREDLIKRMAA